jgi:hypothetical protein
MEGLMDVAHVNDAIVKNYRELRTRIGILALAFPVIVIVIGFRWGIHLQPTLSDYYFAKDTIAGRVDLYPVRLWFCGILFAVGVFLYRYRGFSKNEDRWLSLAGVFALGVAIFPMSVDGKNAYDLSWIGLPQLSLHGICAVVAFVCIGIIIFWYADSTLSELATSHPRTYSRFRTAYFLIGAYMAVAITVSVIMHYMHTDRAHDSYILFAEWSGIWAFAAYWFVKNYELSLVAQELKKRGIGAPQATIAEAI